MPFSTRAIAILFASIGALAAVSGLVLAVILTTTPRAVPHTNDLDARAPIVEIGAVLSRTSAAPAASPGPITLTLGGQTATVASSASVVQTVVGSATDQRAYSSQVGLRAPVPTGSSSPSPTTGLTHTAAPTATP